MPTKAESVTNIRRIADVTHPVAMRVYEATMAEIVAQLKLHGEANLPNIGKLRLVRRGKRSGRNPKTGDRIEIPPTVGVAFSPSSVLKKNLAVES